jgi:hypothetical protein
LFCGAIFDWRKKMTDKDDFFEDLVDTEEFPGDEDEHAHDLGLWADDDDDDLADVRTVLMWKADMVALLGLKTSPQGGIIVRVDPREPRPAAQVYEDPSAATKWFNRSLSSSRKNGWNVIYDGAPAYG